ncbi:MAG: ATP synthase F1 subunit gamma [Planctomycetes bacterium]|nr:ATP synthase F1 subunit gamma [Planctomycetota bacterium]
MANLKELRGRIKSVAGIAQITRAMEMVASMKLRKVQAKAMSFHPYTEELRGVIERLAAKVGEPSGSPWFRVTPPKTTGVLLITSDRGLCGSYNANMFKAMQALAAEVRAVDPDRKLKFWCYGRKGYSWLVRRGYEVERFFVEPALDKLDFRAAKMVVDELSKAFLEGRVDNIRVYHTRFQSMIRFEPASPRFLPVMNRDFVTVEANRAAQEAASALPDLDYLVEPDPAVVFEALLPRYLETVVYDAMLQSVASEHASRRMAMKSATDAAVRMNKGLKKIYNRARQENITKELLDIVGGASAVS